MPQSITVPETTYNVGFHEVVLNSLPGNSEGARIRFTRTAQVEAAVGDLAEINVFMWLNGAWAHVMGSTLSGGAMTDRVGNPLTESVMAFTWPGEAGPNGRVKLKGSDVKIEANVFQALTTAVTIESITSTGR